MDSNSLLNLARGELSTACACHDKAATFAIGQKEFVGQFDGQISVRLGKPLFSNDRLPTIPLHVIGYTTTSEIPGMGRTTLDIDFSRPIAVSDVSASRRQEFFPAVQTMRLQILVTCDAFKGKILRSMSQSALHNREAADFPPPVGSTYTLERPVDLEDIANPGTSLATLKTVNTSIVSTDLSPARITTNSGFALNLTSGKTAVLSEERAGAEIGYDTATAGLVGVTLFDEGSRSLGLALRQHQTAGTHRILIPQHLWRGRARYYQISIDGVPRTALMPLE